MVSMSRQVLRVLLRPVSVVLFLLLHAGASHGAEQSPELPKAPLTLDECIELGLKNATDVRTAELDLRINDLRVKDARGEFLPSVDAQGRYLFNDRVDFGFERDNYDVSVTADYLVWDQGRRRIALDQARSNHEASGARLERSRQNLVFQIVQAYYRLLEAAKLVELDTELLESSRGNAGRVRAFYELEKAIEADVAAAEVRVATDELSLLNDQNAHDIAQANLPTILGLSPDARLSIADEADFDRYLETGKIERYAKSLNETIALAMGQRPEITESRLGLRALELTRKRAQLDRLPRVSAQGNFTANVDDYLNERDDFKKYRTWSASALVQFPVFDGGATKRALDRAELELARVEEQNAELHRTIALDVQQAYLNPLEAEKRLEISAVQVRNADLSLKVTAARFAEGLVIPLELFDAQAQYAQATTSQIRAFYDYKIAQRALDRAVGKRP